MPVDSPPRAGVYTSEFWIAVVSQLLGLLVLTGTISAVDQGTLHSAAAQVIEAVAVIVANAWIVGRYIQSRTTVKSTPPPANVRV